MSRVALVVFAPLLFSCGTESPDDHRGNAYGRPAPSLPTTAPDPLRILVIGGTSGIGLQTVKLALERGHLVTAMARRPERMGMHHPGLTTMSGNILDAEALQRAIADQDAIVIAIGMGPTRKPVKLFSEGTLNVLNGMVAQGVRRLAAVTGIGAGDTRGHGGFFYDRVFWPLALKTIYADKNRQEALIRDYGSKGLVDWTIVRPGFLTDDNPKYGYRVITDLQGVTADKITRADVAHFIVAALESEGYLDETPLLSE